MWGWKAGRRSGHLKEFNKTLWAKRAKGPYPEPRLNLADANVTLKGRTGVSYLIILYIIQHWVPQRILATSVYFFIFLFFLK